MQDIAPLYGKTYHFWQVDRGDRLPTGPPQLMGSFTSPEDAKVTHKEGLDAMLKERNERFAVDHMEDAKKREDIASVEKHAGNWTISSSRLVVD